MRGARRLLLGLGLFIGCRGDERCEPFAELEPPDVPLVRRTEHLDIHSDGFVCAGTALELERHVDFVSGRLGLDLDQRGAIPVYLYESPPEICQPIFPGAYGCAYDGAVFAPPDVLYHELNHAVACPLGSGVAVLREGVAVMFEPRPATTRLSYAKTLDDLLDAEGMDLDYSNAGHFVRWLYERDEPEVFAELYSSNTTLQDSFAAIYARSIADLQTEYFQTAPYAWVPFRQCDDVPHVERDSEGIWRFSAVMDCDDKATMGPYLASSHTSTGEWELMVRSFTFTLETALFIDHDFHGDIDHVVLRRCGEVPPTSEQEADDVFERVVVLPEDPSIDTVGPRLSAGTWRADVLHRYGPPVTVGVGLRPDPAIYMP